MSMSDVLMLAWSNRPIPILIPMFKAGFQLAMHAHKKSEKRKTHARTESVLSCVRFFIIDKN